MFSFLFFRHPEETKPKHFFSFLFFKKTKRISGRGAEVKRKLKRIFGGEGGARNQQQPKKYDLRTHPPEVLGTCIKN
jgi:hypothetical protein